MRELLLSTTFFKPNVVSAQTGLVALELITENLHYFFEQIINGAQTNMTSNDGSFSLVYNRGVQTFSFMAPGPLRIV